MGESFRISFVYLLPRGRSERVLAALNREVETPENEFQLAAVDNTELLTWRRDREDGAGLRLAVERDDFLLPIVSYAEYPEEGVDVLISFHDRALHRGRSVLLKDVTAIEYLSTEKWRLSAKLILLFDFPNRFEADLP